jgi:UDP-N-acetylglucosamine enolpyruvyl transferase
LGGTTLKLIKGRKVILLSFERSRINLTGAIVNAPDLRGGAALVLAGLMAEGFTTVENVEYIERGYENF